MSRLESARPDSLSVPEMLRIMDVATALRQGRELVDEQLNVDQLKERLRERMLAAAKVTGEDVTPEEVDAAIRQYYSSLHTFSEPAMSFPVALAHAWVRRREILAKGGAAVAAGALIWWLFLSPNARLSASGRAHRQAARIAAEIAKQAGVVRSIARDPKVEPELARLAAEADALRNRDDPKGLAAVRDAVAGMETKLGEEYAVTVVSGANRKSVIARDYKNRPSGYYLIVEARKADGQPLARRIHNDETDSDREVTTWGERVPEAVYERLKRDKLDDGILNETAYAVKRKGVLDEEVTMPGLDTRPLARMGRITQW